MVRTEERRREDVGVGFGDAFTAMPRAPVVDRAFRVGFGGDLAGTITPIFVPRALFVGMAFFRPILRQSSAE